MVNGNNDINNNMLRTSVLRIDETQEEAAIAEAADKGEAPPDTREEPHQQAKLGVRDAPFTGGARGCLATEQRRLTPTPNGNDEDEHPPTEGRD